MRRLIFFVVLAGLAPRLAQAHGSEAHGWWSFDPWVWIPLAVAAMLYLRGMLVLRRKRVSSSATRLPAVAGFAGGCAALFVALIWPLDVLGEASFAAHMAQHMLLIAVAAPLLALARPAPVLLAALPARLRRLNSVLGPLYGLLHALSSPRVTFAVHGVLVWLWHAPMLFELALRWRWAHVLEHAAFLGSALLFWSALQRVARSGGEGCGTAVLLTLGTLMHTGVLGALLTFSPRLLYPMHEGRAALGLSAIEDQQLAGLLMWIPGSMAYLTAGLCFVAVWLRKPAMQ